MFVRLLIVAAAISLFGCGTQKPTTVAPDSLPKNLHPTSSQQSDPELDEAIGKAHKTLDSFVGRIQHPERGEVFTVETNLKALDGTPLFLWVGDVTYKNGVFSGTLQTKPAKATTIKYLEPATVKKEDVTDWMIMKSGKSEGGFTIDVLLRREGQPH